MKKYFYTDGTNSLGPFSLEELKEKKITRETNVWFHELGEWKEAGGISELSELFTFSPPPFKSQNLNIHLDKGTEKRKIDVFLFITIIFWFFSDFSMFIISKLVPNWYNTPAKYYQITINIIFSLIPIIFALSIRDKVLRIIALILGGITSIYILYINISGLF